MPQTRKEPGTGDLSKIRTDKKYTELHIKNVEKALAHGNWQKLPHHVFGDIMTMTGRESLLDLQKCRQVCQSWNVMISQMTKFKKDIIKRKAEILAVQIKAKWTYQIVVIEGEGSPPTLPEITTAASLAHHGLLGSVELMSLRDVDLASVPAEHLASLASCVTMVVGIQNVNNFDIILNHVKCEMLYISGQTLNSEKTRLLVRAMESGRNNSKG